MFIDCLSSCSGFAAAFGLLEGTQMMWLISAGFQKRLTPCTRVDKSNYSSLNETDAQSLALWRIDDRKGCLQQKNRSKFLDTGTLIFSTLTTDTEKFTAADIRYCSKIDDVSQLIIIGVTRSRIYRWEIRRSFSSNRWECTDLTDFDVIDFSIQKISLCGTGGFVASFDSASGEANFDAGHNLLKSDV